ncbi:MAG: TIGR02300 family protein, partial [Bauldia sp.]
MTKVELGTKRLCPNCGTKYYDLNRSPIVCPKCGTVFAVAAAATAARARAQAAAKAPVEEEEVEVVPKEAELVSLEEADEEVAESGAVKVEGVDDEDAAEAEEP